LGFIIYFLFSISGFPYFARYSYLQKYALYLLKYAFSIFPEFESVRGAPEIGKPKWIIHYLDLIDVNFKRLKQSIIFLYVITIYILYLYMTINQFKNNDQLKYFNLIIIIIHANYLAITHLPNGHYENTRIVYGGFVFKLIFFVIYLN
jgi:hypothetical protein